MARDEPALFVCTDHDHGEPGPVIRLRSSFESFATLPQNVGDITFGPRAWVRKHNWRLMIFPGGCDEEDKDYVSVGLDLCEPYPEAEVKARATLRVINHAGRKHKVRAIDEVLFFTKNESFGIGRFIKRAKVHANKGWLKDGALVVEADICVYTPAMQYPQSSLGKEYLEFNSCKNYDFTFIVGDEIVRVHRVVLQTRAPFLANLCNEADGRIEISGVSPAVFKEILRFTYCDELSSPKVLSTLEGASDLLAAAARFGLNKLKDIAEIELATCHLNSENAFEVLLFASAYSCPKLKAAATRLFVSKEWKTGLASQRLASPTPAELICETFEHLMKSSNRKRGNLIEEETHLQKKLKDESRVSINLGMISK